MKKNKKGITMLTLVLTISLLLILASIAAYVALSASDKGIRNIENIKRGQLGEQIETEIATKLLEEQYVRTNLPESMIRSLFQNAVNEVATKNEIVSPASLTVNMNRYPVVRVRYVDTSKNVSEEVYKTDLSRLVGDF